MSYVVIIIAFIVLGVRLVTQFNKDGKKTAPKKVDKVDSFPASLEEILRNLSDEEPRVEYQKVEEPFSYETSMDDEISGYQFGDYQYEEAAPEVVNTAKKDENYAITDNTTTNIDFDAREAIIYSTILEKKYID